MTQSYRSIRPMLLGKSILWIGLPETPPSLVPCMSADLTGVYADAGSADTLFLPLTKQGMGARELKQKLSAFVGPFDAIVLSSGFLDAQGYMLPAIKTVLLKLCHHLSLVIVERACNDEGAEKVLIELTKVLTLSLPGLPVGRTLKVADEQSLAYRHTPNARSTVEDRLRQRWGGLTTRTSNVHNPKCWAAESRASPWPSSFLNAGIELNYLRQTLRCSAKAQLSLCWRPIHSFPRTQII
jgi:hypothetical protein